MKTLLSDPNATFYTTGNGLRGVPVLVMDRDTGALIWATIYSNTATQLRLDQPLSRNPDQYDAYAIGAIPVCIESGDLTFGFPRSIKSVKYLTCEYERKARGSIDVYFASDQTDQDNSAWQYAGLIPFTGHGFYRLPILVKGGTGRAIRYLLLNTLPGIPIAITHLSLEWELEQSFE